jgi:hypothetical protein
MSVWNQLNVEYATSAISRDDLQDSFRKKESMVIITFLRQKINSNLFYNIYVKMMNANYQI